MLLKETVASRLFSRFDLARLSGFGHRAAAPLAELIEALCRAPLPASALRVVPREQEVRYRLTPGSADTQRIELSVWFNVTCSQAIVISFTRPLEDDGTLPSPQHALAPETAIARLEQHIEQQCRQHGWQLLNRLH